MKYDMLLSYLVWYDYSQRGGDRLVAKAIWFISYKLVKDADVSEFLAASRQCHDEVLSKHKGFISWQVLAKDDTWVDFVTWETKEDAINAEKNSDPTNPVAAKFYSFINFNSIKSQIYTIEKNY